MKSLVVCCALVLGTGCHRVVVQMDSDDENFKLSLPYALVESAIRFNADELVIDDLGGVDATVNLRDLAIALSESKGAARIEITQGESRILAFVEGTAVRIQLDDPNAEERVRIYFPLQALQRIDPASDRLDAAVLAKALRRYRGPLVEFESPYERISIAIK